MARHREVSLPKTGNKLVFSGGKRRSVPAAVLLIIVLASLTAGAVNVRGVLVAPAKRVPFNTDVRLPSEIANDMGRCGHSKGPETDVPLVGQGVFRRVVEVRRSGGTTYALDPFTGTIVRPLTLMEQYLVGTCRYAVDQFGVVPPHTLALTYDDGPSAAWTPRLLEILRAFHVHATFFTIGLQLVATPAIFRQEIVAGNAVGNHTYYHHELTTENDMGARTELTMTAHAQALVGHYVTHLFRPPYGGSDGVSIWADRRETLVAQQNGFVSVGFDIDSEDWRYGRRGATVPVPRLTGQGAVILMHDGGGYRRATLNLTVQIIQEAQSQGYRFVTIPQLLARTRSVSRTTPSRADYVSYYWQIGAQDVRQGVALRWLFWFSTKFVLAVTVLTLATALVSNLRDRRRRRRRGNPEWWPPGVVNVLVAAHNEEKPIERTVRTILSYARPDRPLELVVVNDASTDRTSRSWTS